LRVQILYRDENLIICEKPVGISSESPGLPDIISDMTGVTVYPVHRLDTGTGGVAVLALSKTACQDVQNIFQNRLIIKEYFAVVEGIMPEKNGVFADYLFHDKYKNKSYVVSRPRKGVKEASCEWSVTDSIHAKEGTLSLIKIKLHTGRTHQIRVQFGSRGFPLVGDRKYGSRIKAEIPALWAFRIRFKYPSDTKSYIDVHSFPPRTFPWDLFSELNYE